MGGGKINFKRDVENMWKFKELRVLAHEVWKRDECLHLFERKLLKSGLRYCCIKCGLWAKTLKFTARIVKTY